MDWQTLLLRVLLEAWTLFFNAILLGDADKSVTFELVFEGIDFSHYFRLSLVEHNWTIECRTLDQVGVEPLGEVKLLRLEVDGRSSVLQ